MFRFLQNRENITKELQLKPSKGDYNIRLLNCIHTHVASLMFVVTQFDHFYSSGAEENNPDEEGVKEEITSTFSDIAAEDVYPVCGKWALSSYLVKASPINGGVKDVIRDAYVHYRRKRNPSESVTKLEDKTDFILKASHFEEIEGR